ncbi:efflux RND transporter periplasmic adaptor subunit [Paenibacillus aceris]|uniref:Multidrug efflux pump subunit AcrA (Membrane-fusion protein) n=1 Tax=Paenibacillus aceris TaxID=869555 RepID=A0ABS4HRU6_9BACL|nr:efflux RND transporter periplasmic adaptor subunit [Paenibacillus aceris]MBP1961342.1 multidrug efflux pump subunit AcrA (membrane-fusion protein) [Paenibacillus aceris]NHW37874.1 efflux RND transporter periplasmic adaptor subunit [Paenibacillus aceris]
MKRQLFTIKQSAKLFGVVAISAAIAVGCSATPAASPTATSAAAAEQGVKVVKTAKIAKQKIGNPVEQVGDVVSSIQLDVVAKSGGEIIEIAKKRGDKVEKGEVLFRLDPTDTLIQKDLNAVSIKGAQAGLVEAKQKTANGIADAKDGVSKLETTVSDLEKAYNKARNEYDLGTATKTQLEQAETALTNMKKDLESARRSLKTLQETNSLAQVETSLESAQVSARNIDRALSNLEVKAPASGVLTDLNVTVGQTLAPGVRVGEVQQTNPVKIKSQLTEASASLVRGKGELTFYIPGASDKASAKVTYLSDVINGQSKAYDLELEVPNPDGKLKPGSKAQIELTKDDEQIVPVIPSLSIVHEGGDSFVYIVNGETVQKRKVELGRLNETNQEVLSGVKEGDILVISGQHQLKDQDKIKVSN